MQIYAINGSPRKKWNTATILDCVLEGAAEAGSDVLTERIDLYDFKYTGCISCFQCKLVGGPSYGKCVVNDQIKQLLQNVLHADAIVLGSPIYFGDLSGMMRCFLERLLFPCFVYDENHSSIAPKKVRTAFVYTMNVPYDMMESYHYPTRLGLMESFVANILGSRPHVQYVNNTLQVKDYAQYKMELFSEEEKLKYRQEVFPLDCQKARELGATLMEEAAR